MTLGFLDKLPGSETVGVLNGFLFDNDWEYEDEDLSYAIDDMAWELANKEYCDKNNIKPPTWPIYRNAQQYAKATNAYHEVADKIDEWWNNSGKKFHKQAELIIKKKAAARKAKELTELKQKITKSKYETIIAVTNHSDQKHMEKILVELKFKIILKFTNPHHNRMDTLQLWKKEIT